MTGKKGRPGGNHGGGKARRPNAKRINVLIDNGIHEYLKRTGNVSLAIETIVRNHMDNELKTRARIDKMGFTQDEQDFIFGDWPNWDEHMDWLLTATREEIASWIKAGQE